MLSAGRRPWPPSSGSPRPRRPASRAPPVRDLIGTDDLAAAYACRSRLLNIRAGSRPGARSSATRSARPRRPCRTAGRRPARLRLPARPTWTSVAATTPVSMRAATAAARRGRGRVRPRRDIDLPEEELHRGDVRGPSRSRCRRWRSSTRRIARLGHRFTDTIADNASSGLLRRRAATGRPLDELDLRDVEMALTRNGEEVVRRPVAAVPRRPGRRRCAGWPCKVAALRRPAARPAT